MSILEVSDEEYTFKELSTSIQTGRFESVEVSDDLNPLVGHSITNRLPVSAVFSIVDKKHCLPAAKV